MIKKVIGLFIIIVGILLFLSNLEIINFNDVSQYLLPSLVLIIGIVGMFERKKVDIFFLIIALLGFTSLILALGIIDKNLINTLMFPIILILVGIRVLSFRIIRPRISSEKKYTAIFGGLEEKNIDKNFESCDVTSIFGGSKIDFRNIKLKSNKGYITVFVLFGGSEIIVSKKHKITVESAPIFGGIENKAVNSDGKDEIIINCTAIFGGIEIKNKDSDQEE